MLTSQFILALKEELRFQVEMQLPESVAKAAVLAAMQEKLLEKNMKHHSKTFSNKHQGVIMKSDTKSIVSPSDLWKPKQLRETGGQMASALSVGTSLLLGINV
jgi:hypothetical protein